MEDRKRTVIAVIIACVVLVAVLYSFGQNLFIQTPELVLPDPYASDHMGQVSANPEAGGIPVEVTPQTVQLVVASLTRFESYSRNVTAAYLQNGETVGTISAQVWVDDGWVRTDTMLPSGVMESSVVGDGKIWLWYDGSDEVYQTVADEHSADLTQRLPTYEDVLTLDASGITQADYVERDGQDCIYLEFEQPELGYLYRYWISVSSGLLIAAETEKAGELVYTMSSYGISSPLSEELEMFVLPDGTTLRS